MPSSYQPLYLSLSYVKFHSQSPEESVKTETECGRVVKVADFSALDHSIISPMWVRASHGARIHM